jgi:hypothetical protein
MAYKASRKGRGAYISGMDEKSGRMYGTSLGKRNTRKSSGAKAVIKLACQRATRSAARRAARSTLPRYARTQAG